jgi:tRNA dimethylallyltransferase
MTLMDLENSGDLNRVDKFKEWKGSADTRQKAVVIAGPTASGKSACAVELAKLTDGAVLSIDSMQIYQGMNIGTAKVTEDEKQGIPHFLLDFLQPGKDCSISLFQEKADEALRECRNLRKMPILAGGTGFYLHAVLYGNDFSSDTGADQELREKLAAFADEHGNEALHERLSAVDPEAAKAIHPNNRKRVIRALEYFAQTGQKISDHNKRERARESRLRFAGFFLVQDREKLYARINARVDAMRESGLTEEVRQLLVSGVPEDSTSMQAIGYKELTAFLKGECSEDEAYEAIKMNSRHYAKRQFTWFSREPGLERIDIDAYGADPKKIAQYMKLRCQEEGITD